MPEPKSNPNERFAIQIDVIAIGETQTICNFFTGERCVKIAMLTSDYEALKRDKFFIRTGDTRDSANVLNTTCTYKTSENFTS